MSLIINLQEILSSVKKLERKEQQTLLEQLTALVSAKNKSGKTKKLTTLSGTGAGIWKDSEVEAYIEQQRRW